MSSTQYNADYLLDSEQETLRLERQARIYGFEDDLRFTRLSPGHRVLDAGCGSGSITRAIAKVLRNGSVTGVDREAKYIDYA
jgi:tRNA A58 N-methylase Trm61